RVFAGGICLGLAYETRPEALLTIVGVGVAALAWPRLGRRWHALGALVLGLALVIAPYGLWMKARLGRFDPAPKVALARMIVDISDHIVWLPHQRTMFMMRIDAALTPEHDEFLLFKYFADPDGFDPRPYYPRQADHSEKRYYAGIYGLATEGM